MRNKKKVFLGCKRLPGKYKKKFFVLSSQGVTKRCRLSWLTISALVYEPKCGGGRGGVVESQLMSTAVYMELKKTLEIYM